MSLVNVQGGEIVIGRGQILFRRRERFPFFWHIVPQTDLQPLHRCEGSKPKSVLRCRFFIRHERVQLIGRVQMVF